MAERSVIRWVTIRGKKVPITAPQGRKPSATPVLEQTTADVDELWDTIQIPEDKSFFALHKPVPWGHPALEVAEYKMVMAGGYKGMIGALGAAHLFFGGPGSRYVVGCDAYPTVWVINPRIPPARNAEELHEFAQTVSRMLEAESVSIFTVGDHKRFLRTLYENMRRLGGPSPDYDDSYWHMFDDLPEDALVVEIEFAPAGKGSEKAAVGESVQEAFRTSEELAEL